MPTEAQVMAALAKVNDPEIHKPITELNMVKGVTIDGRNVIVEILLTVAGCPLKDRITKDVTQALTSTGEVDRVEVHMGVMTEEQRRAMVEGLRGPAGAQGQQQERPIAFWAQGSTTRAILVASGKGGVGKSSTTANLAVALAQQGLKVGVVDCDVYGYSIPRMLGVHGRPVAFEGMFLPLEGNGVKVVSIGFFVPEDQPVVWRGPMLHKAIHQFLADAYWGDIDIVLLDMPPGTGDVAISVAQYLPGAEMLIVTTPQEAAAKVAARAGKITDQVNLKVLGVIENMAHFICPSCDEKHEIFGSGGGAALAASLDTELLGQIPLDVAHRSGSDEGKPIVVTDPESPAAKALIALAQKIARKGPSLVGRPLPLAVSK